MKLYSYFRSSAAFRVRIALNLKQIRPDETAFIHLRRAEHDTDTYRARNPQGLVPALELDSGAVIGQSLAIMEYLEETKPEPPILPADPEGRARVRSLAMIFACEVHPLQNMRVLAQLRGSCKLDDAGATAWAAHWNRVGLAAYERALTADRRTGAFSHGDRPGMADACLVPQVFSAQRFEVDLNPYPRVMQIHRRCMALAAFDEAQPSRQPDAEP